METHVQVNAQQGKENAFTEREKEAGWAKVNKEYMAFHSLSPCQERKGVFPLPIGLLYSRRV